MPQYKNNSELPDHVQDIYRNAFNNAWEQYADSKDRKEGRDQEETSHAVALSAVENVYKKGENGKWEKRDD